MATKRITTILWLLCTTLGGVSGQGEKSCSAYNALRAQRELAQGTPKLLVYGGIAPIRRAGDSAVEKQFGFGYQDFGCLRPLDDRCLRAYSRVVFASFDRKYGKAWRARVRLDVLFITALPYSSGE